MFDLKLPCVNCPFRIGGGESFRLNRRRLDEIVSAAAFACHKTVRYDEETQVDEDNFDETWRPIKDDRKAQQCAGLMSLLHRAGLDNQIMQVAQRLTGFDASKLDHSSVYASLADAYIAHTGEPPMTETNTETIIESAQGRGMQQKRKTHCPHGHPYEGNNLIIMKVKRDGVDTGKTKRQCRQCKAEDSSRRRKGND